MWVDEGSLDYLAILLTAIFGDKAYLYISDLLRTYFFGRVYALAR